MGTCSCIFFPAPNPTYTPKDIQQLHKSASYLRLPTTQGDFVNFLFMPYFVDDNSLSSNCLIYFHGNAEDLGVCSFMLEELRTSLKLNVIGMEYIGYGETHNQSTNPQTIKTHSQQLYKFVTERMGFAEENIVIFGRSIGSGPAAYLSSRTKSGNLILMSPFFSIKNVTKEHAGFLSCIVRDFFHNGESVSYTQARLLAIHGEMDTVINIQNCRKLEKEYQHNHPNKGIFVYPKRMTHNSFDMDRDILNHCKDFLAALKMQRHSLERVERALGSLR